MRKYGSLLASNSFLDLRHQKQLCPCCNAWNFEQIHLTENFCRICGIAVMQSVTISTVSKNINKMPKSTKSNCSIYADSFFHFNSITVYHLNHCALNNKTIH